MKKAWPPDWKTPNDYPGKSCRSVRRWAWEFLRRNPAYQKAFTELGQLTPKEQIAKTPIGESFRQTRRMFCVWQFYDPAATLTDRELKTLFMPHESCLWFYGPWNEQKDIDWDKELDAIKGLQENHVLILIDLREGINSQIADLRDIVTRLRKYSRIQDNRGPRPNQYQTYLRLLDARAVQPKPFGWGTIAKHIPTKSTDPQTARQNMIKMHKTAVALRDNFQLILKSKL